MRWWEELYTGSERSVYEGTFRGVRQPMGKRPALLVIDVTMAFTGRPGLSLEESAREWPTSCGPAAWEAIPYIARVIRAAREAAVPVVYTTALPGADKIYGGTVKGELGPMKSPMAWPGAQDIPGEIAPLPGELVLQKPKASAFFGTALLAYLHRDRVDSLIVVGTTTSGCVRATVVDGFSWGYPTFVVDEAVFDRSRLSHAVNLFDMNAKYADVIDTAAAEAWLAGLKVSV